MTMSVTEKELRDLINEESDVERVSSVSSDGKNLLTRIPKEIVEKLGLKKGYKLRWMSNKGKINLGIIKKNAKEED